MSSMHAIALDCGVESLSYLGLLINADSNDNTKIRRKYRWHRENIDATVFWPVRISLSGEQSCLLCWRASQLSYFMDA